MKEPELEVIVQFIENLVVAKTDGNLSFIQKTILRESLSEDPKTYAQIAEENRYSENYIKQWVAPKLWQLLSSALNEKVNKANCRALLEQKFNHAQLNPIAQPIINAQLDYDRPYPNSDGENNLVSGIKNPVSAQSDYLTALESPEGQVPLASGLYIERDRIEEITCQEILRSGAFIRIKAPKKMGKTSLMARILAYGAKQGYATVRLSLQSAGTQIFSSVEKFLRWFCATITLKLGLDSKLDDYWDQELGALVSCTIYFEGYLLEKVETPIILALDELNQIFEYPDLARDFLALLRSWHEETKDISIWQKLRLIIVHSTDIYIPIDINQSPFNVGLAIELPAFTHSQVRDLAQRHCLDLTPQDLTQLMRILGGFPYLTRLAFYHRVRDNRPLKELLQEAVTETGIYSNHLHYQLRKLQQAPELGFAFRQVLKTQYQKLDIEVAVKLRSLGLIHLEGDRATVSCELYRQYFERLFGDLASLEP